MGDESYNNLHRLERTEWMIDICRVRIVKNELGGSATQQEQKDWGGVGVTMEWTGELGFPNPRQFELWIYGCMECQKQEWALKIEQRCDEGFNKKQTCDPLLDLWYNQWGVYKSKSHLQRLNAGWNSVYRRIFGFNKMELGEILYSWFRFFGLKTYFYVEESKVFLEIA